MNARRRREIEKLAGVVKRPRKYILPEPEPIEPEPEEDAPDLTYKNVYEVKQGVPVRWLSLVFGLTTHSVQRRLKDLRPAEVGSHGNPLYLVTEAAPYLVEPKVNLKEFLAGIKDDDLPDDLRLKLWSARRARNRVLEEEGELWHSGLVLAKFSEVLLSMREKLQLIPEKIERMSGITPEQYKLIRGVVDAVQEDMHKAILEIAANDDTPSVLGAEEADEVVL